MTQKKRSSLREIDYVSIRHSLTTALVLIDYWREDKNMPVDQIMDLIKDAIRSIDESIVPYLMNR